MYQELAPETLLEESLTAEITGATWRLRRCSAAEAELADYAAVRTPCSTTKPTKPAAPSNEPEPEPTPSSTVPSTSSAASKPTAPAAKPSTWPMITRASSTTNRSPAPSTPPPNSLRRIVPKAFPWPRSRLSAHPRPAPMNPSIWLRFVNPKPRMSRNPPNPTKIPPNRLRFVQTKWPRPRNLGKYPEAPLPLRFPAKIQALLRSQCRAGPESSRINRVIGHASSPVGPPLRHKCPRRLRYLNL